MAEERTEVEVLDEDGVPVVDPKTTLPARVHTGVVTTGKAAQDLLQAYLTEVRQYPLLDPEEEKALAVRYIEHGDEEAGRALVTANLRLVVKLAFQYHRAWSNVLDLIQEGNVGLMEALNKYDPYRGIRFSSYAQYWIRAMILRFIMDNFRLVRLGSTRHGRKLFFQLKKERDRLISEGFEGTTFQIAERMDIPEHEVSAVDVHLRAPALSFQAPAGADPDGRALQDVIPDRTAVAVDDQVAALEIGDHVRQALDAFGDTLTELREQAIWSERLTAADPLPLSRLGERFGVSKERIRQIEARMRKRLKAFLEAELGDEIAFEFQVPVDS
jgi:RNA polymerase sigma-32 factor